MAYVNLTKAYDIDGPILEPVSAKWSDSRGKLDDGQFAPDFEVKFARSSLNVSRDLEIECCIYFAQLQETVAHAVATPITETAVAIGNANPYSVETGVMNGPVVVNTT